ATHEGGGGPEGNDREPDGENADHSAPHPDRPAPKGPEDQGPDGDSGPEQDGPDGGAGGVGSVADQRAPRGPVGAGMELRARLSTLLGRDQHPAELAGWGPIHAELARYLTTTLGGAQWRFSITDEHGRLSHCGITRARPTGTTTRTASCRATVELQIPAITLRALGEHPAAWGAWAHVVTDIHHQLDRDTADQDRDDHRRTPGAALSRYLETRDRSCVMIGCRAPACGTDTDHTRDHARGGPTTDSNLGHVCRHDHRLKHEGGWQLHQPQPGHFHWRRVDM
ncbi:MAG: HNH endonuclease signature motif containing protein, partial [Pseudonocardiaceae bacterium]